MRSTFGGYRPFAGFVPDADATVAARLTRWTSRPIPAGRSSARPRLRGVRDAPDRASGAVDRHVVHRPDPQVPGADHGRADGRSIADLRLALQVISGPDGRDPEVPPVPWRETGPAELAGLRVAYAPGYPPSVAAEIRAGTDALAGELDKLG
jgi:Asp-tRNA(Asn)/Glu-tRNA(Gln) amidotransferase A subunit family amidase